MRTAASPSTYPGLGVVIAAAFVLLDAVSPASSDDFFRVCADPNNLPFSDRNEAGFENRLAAFIAEKLGRKVEYTWWAQRRGFIRNTLKAGDCDVVMGVPSRLDMVDTTRPYYRSTYVFVSRSDRSLHLQSIKDERLRGLKIGVQLIGNDGANTPPAHALSQQGIVGNVVGYTVYGDYRQAHPPARIVEAVAQGVIDVAAVWGPLAGYFAQRSPVPLTLTQIADADDFAPLAFQYDIAVGVRKGDSARKAEIDTVLARHRGEITRILQAYGVPLVNMARGAQ